MIKIAGVILFIFISLFAYLYMYAENRKLSFIAAIISVKTAIILLIFAGAKEGLPVFLFAFTGGIAVILLVGIVLDAKPEKMKREYLVMMLFIMVALLFSGGCSEKKELKMPEIKNELQLNFIPSKVMSSGKKELYIGAERGKGIYHYDMKKSSRLDVFYAGMYPVDMIKNGNEIYVATKQGAGVTVYNEETGEKNDIRTRGTYSSAIALDPVRKRLYVANMGSSNISIVDLEKKESIKRISTGKWPSDLHLSDDRKYLFITCKYTNTVEIIDVETEHIVFTKVHTGTSPVSIIPLNKRDMAILNEWEYAFNHMGSITIFDGMDYTIEDSLMIDGGAFDGVVSKSRKYLYISIPLKDKVVFIDMRKKEKVFELQMEDSMPRYMALSSDGKTLYVTGQKDKKIIMVGVNDLI